MNLRYAQEYGGQQLHLVTNYGDGKVAFRAACGRTPARRGTWRMTINVPLGHACKNCLRVLQTRRDGGHDA
jgi:hypothetical protein